MTLLFLYFLLLINLAAFLTMGLDKRKARKNKWRIRERTLFLIAVFGGSPGILLGMYTFRHKTKHRSFVFGIPAILLMQAAGILFCIYHFKGEIL